MVEGGACFSQRRHVQESLQAPFGLFLTVYLVDFHHVERISVPKC